MLRSSWATSTRRPRSVRRSRCSRASR